MERFSQRGPIPERPLPLGRRPGLADCRLPQRGLDPGAGSAVNPETRPCRLPFPQRGWTLERDLPLDRTPGLAGGRLPQRGLDPGAGSAVNPETRPCRLPFAPKGSDPGGRSAARPDTRPCRWPFTPTGLDSRAKGNRSVAEGHPGNRGPTLPPYSNGVTQLP